VVVVLWVVVPACGAVEEVLDSRHEDHDRHKDHRIDRRTVSVHGLDDWVEEALFENHEEEVHWNPNRHRLHVASGQRDRAHEVLACFQILPLSSKLEHC